MVEKIQRVKARTAREFAATEVLEDGANATDPGLSGVTVLLKSNTLLPLTTPLPHSLLKEQPRRGVMRAKDYGTEREL
jgi:hypothetical protein